MNSFELQKAIYTLLTTALDGTALVYDEVPQDAAFPYAVIGATVSDEPWDADDFYGRETEVEVHTWSRYDGQKQLKNMMDLIKEALHDQEISVVGTTVVLCHWEFAATALDPDGRTRHGIQRFRFITIGD